MKSFAPPPPFVRYSLSAPDLLIKFHDIAFHFIWRKNTPCSSLYSIIHRCHPLAFVKLYFIQELDIHKKIGVLSKLKLSGSTLVYILA